MEHEMGRAGDHRLRVDHSRVKTNTNTGAKINMNANANTNMNKSCDGFLLRNLKENCGKDIWHTHF